jgi:iron complex transport system substrate-binding protein
MQRRTRTTITALLVLTAIAAGCSRAEETGPTDQPSVTGDVDTSAFPVTVTDDTGTALTFDEPVERVVCVYVTCGEAVGAVGLTPVGVSFFYIEPLEQLETLGYFEYDGKLTPIDYTGDGPGVEEIAATQPDLIWTSANEKPYRDALETIAPVFVENADGSYEDAITLTGVMGQITGRTAQAQAAIDGFQARFEAYASQKPEPPLSAVDTGCSAKEPCVGTTKAVVTSLLGEFFDVSAWEPPADVFPNGIAPIAPDAFLSADPAVVFWEQFEDPLKPEKIMKEIEPTPLAGLSAIDNGTLFVVSGGIWSSRGIFALQHVMDVALTSAYPETYPEPFEG